MSKYTVKAGMHFFGETLVKVGDTVESKAALDPNLFEKLPEPKAKAKEDADALKAKTDADAKAKPKAKTKADAETKGGTADNAGNLPEGGTGAAGQE